MKPERFARFKELLLALRDLPTSEHRAYLDTACQDDPELRREVEATLAHEANRLPVLRTGGGIPSALRGPVSPAAAPAGELPGDAAATSSPGMSTAGPLPDRIGPYPIEGELGRGGMGVVYHARDPRLQRQIAIKLLPSSVAGDPHFAQSFEREARILAAVNHPNFATIYSLEEADGIHFMTMELIPGSTLAEEISESGPLTIDVTLARCRQVAAALEAAHRQGIVHLDLKPQNVMVTPDGAVKVLDFGLGRFLGARSEASGATADADTSTGVALGTPGYMSPEQIRGEAADHRADVWAFGCIAYECLTARRTFKGWTPPAAFEAILDTEPDWEALPKNTSGPLRELLSSCLVKDPDERLATMTEARRAIEEEIAQRTWRAARPQPGSRDESAPNNLPVPLTSFVGRRRELEEVKRLLNANRLLTLTGAGGCGKSRLAVEMAKEVLRDFADGVWLVELGVLADPGLVPQAVAAALGLKEERGRVLTETLVDHLSERTLLLVLDNCEHPLGSCAELAEILLGASPGLRIVATSRAGLGMASETTYRVPSLELPDPEPPATVEELREVESIELFIERTGTAAVPVFSLTAETCTPVAEICRRLDGIPLAIELAAARTRMMSVKEIADRLDDRFRLLTGGSPTAPPRHQTLHALIDWSWEQLLPGEQALLRRLSVFAGGWTLGAAEEVCADDGIEQWEVLDLLSNLVDKSLVEVGFEGTHGTGATRYRLLETVHEYARHQLEVSGEGAAFQQAHRDYYLAIAEEAAPQFAGPEQAVWLARLDWDHDNLRAAVDACNLMDEAEVVLGARFAAALGPFWAVRGFWSEGRAVCAKLLMQSRTGEISTSQAHTLRWAGALAERQGDIVEARSLALKSLAAFRGLGDKSGIDDSLFDLGQVSSDQGEYAEARTLHEEGLAIAREIGDQHGIASHLACLGNLAWHQGDYVKAIALHKEGLSILRDLGEKSGIAPSLNLLGTITMEQGDYAGARLLHEECLAIGRELRDDRVIGWSLNALGNIAAEQGDHAEARSRQEESLAILRKLGDKKGMAWALHALGLLGDASAARPYQEESLATFRKLGNRRGVAWALVSLGNGSSEQRDYAAAQSFYDESLGIFRELGDKRGVAGTLHYLGNVAIDQGNCSQARSLHAESLMLFREMSDPLGIAISFVRMGVIASSQGNDGRAARLLAAATALAEDRGFALEVSDSRLIDEQLSVLRNRLSSADFERESAAGRAMGIDKAIEYALGE